MISDITITICKSEFGKNGQASKIKNFCSFCRQVFAFEQMISENFFTSSSRKMPTARMNPSECNSTTLFEENLFKSLLCNSQLVVHK